MNYDNLIFNENMSIVDLCMLIAMRGHSQHINEHDGTQYIEHVGRVVGNVRQRCVKDTIRDELLDKLLSIAWLHDVVEDGHISLDKLKNMLIVHCDFRNSNSVINDIIRGVDAITKRADETLDDYYNRINGNEQAKYVKLYGDIKDNVARNKFIKDEETRNRLMAKYSKCIVALTIG